jgi:hypothetical protein
VQRHHHGVVLVAHAALALGGQDADHLARELLDAQLLAQPRCCRGAAEDLAPHGFADDADRRTGALLVGAKRRPLASFQLPVSNQALVLPMTLVAQLRPLATTVALARPCGATAATPPIWLAMASASASVNCGTPPPPPPGRPGPRCPASPSAGWCPGW